MIWLIPLLIYMPLYYRSIKFSVKAKTGKTRPEVYVKNGILTITSKHVPFRTITNISSIQDHLINFLASVQFTLRLQVILEASRQVLKSNWKASYSMIKLETFLNELRKFKTPYVTGTEVIHPIEGSVPTIKGLDDEILITLDEIRNILKELKES